MVPELPAIEAIENIDFDLMREYMTESFFYKFLEAFFMKSIEKSLLAKPPIDPLSPVDVSALEKEMEKKRPKSAKKII